MHLLLNLCTAQYIHLYYIGGNSLFSSENAAVTDENVTLVKGKVLSEDGDKAARMSECVYSRRLYHFRYGLHFVVADEGNARTLTQWKCAGEGLDNTLTLRKCSSKGLDSTLTL